MNLKCRPSSNLRKGEEVVKAKKTFSPDNWWIKFDYNSEKCLNYSTILTAVTNGR